MNQRGVVITKGPQDWQIFQQKNGAADIALEGSWTIEDDVPGAVYARIVREDTGESILPWTKAEVCGDHRWVITLRGIPSGGLYRVETGFAPDDLTLLEWMARGDMAHHLAVGDLYVIAGQSNSAGYGKDMVYDPPELGIHLFKNSGRWDLASHPLNESTDTIHAANREGGNPGHSPWLAFARMVKRETGMPVGLVQTSLGGSPLDDWLPGGVLYNNMMEIIAGAGGAVRGVLWYQGCSDASFPLCGTYLDRFNRFVNGARADLGDPALPFITVQICKYVAGEPDESADLAWSIVREAQRQAALQIPGVTVIPTMDCILSDAIHISAVSNMALGERAARLALARLYGKRAAADAPEIASAKLVEDGILLTFKNVTQRIYTLEVPASRLPFRLEDELGEVGIASYVQPKEDTVLLLKPARPIRGRCAIASHYGRDPQGMPVIDTGTRLPVAAFYGVVVE
jgi:sialate O-acetylesterase